jgi:type I restriction enzyme S subunit
MEQTTRNQVSVTKQVEFRLFVPPLAEQHEIVRRVEALFWLADAIEKRVTAATARADKLTQAILAKAFRGELVPTEAEIARREGRDYEPASVLLERIRAEREAVVGQSSRLPKRGGKNSVRQRKGIKP